MIGLKEDKDPEELPYIDDLASLLRSSPGRMPTAFLSGLQLCLASVLTEHTCLWVLSHLLLCDISNDKLCTCIHSFCLCDRCIFH